MRSLAILALTCACGQPARRPPAPAAPKPPVPVAEANPFAPWPMPMNALTWTPEGIAGVGELPSLPRSAWPTEPWFVEATAPLDRPRFERIVAALRSERVPGLSLRGQPDVAPWLGLLRDLPELRYLVLDDTAVDGAALASIDLPLERIYLARTRIGDAAIVALAARTPRLAVIDLEDTGTGDAALRALSTLPLQAVNLAGTRITDQGGAALRSLAKLEIVDLGRTVVGARTVAALRELAIRELFIDQTRVGKEIATLAPFAPGIRRFDASSLATYRPSDADVGWLARAPELVEVGLSGSRVTDKLVLELVKLPKLWRLRLAAAPITIASIRAIAARVDLREVDLAATPVDDEAGAALVGGPVMQILRLDDTPITDATLLHGDPGIGLGTLYLSRTKITDAGLAVLDKLPHLTGLGLGEDAIGAPTLARIGKLRDLRLLVLSKIKAEPEALASLAGLTLLQSLYLEGTRAGDATLAALAQLRELRVLHLASTDVSDAALPVLRGFRKLEELTIGDTRVGPPIADLAAWPRLRTLSVAGLLLGDPALPSIVKRPSLALLDLSGTDVTELAPLAALPNLRTLGVSQLKLSKASEAAARALAARGVEIVR